MKIYLSILQVDEKNAETIASVSQVANTHLPVSFNCHTLTDYWAHSMGP